MNPEDIQALQDYAARMQAMGDSAQQQTPPPPDDDIKALQDYADSMSRLKDQPPALGDKIEDPNGPLAANMVEAVPTQPQGARGMLGFAIPESVTEGAKQVAPQALYQDAKKIAANPEGAKQAAGKLYDIAAEGSRRADEASWVPDPSGLVMPGLAVPTLARKMLSNSDTADVAKRRAEAEKAKELETAHTQSGAGTEGGDVDRAVEQGRGVPAPMISPERWARVNSPESRALEEQIFGEGRKRELQDQEIDQRLLNNKMIEAAAQKEGEDRAELERARLERQRSHTIMQKHQEDLDAANKAYMAAKVDPDRFYKNRSTGDNIMSAIGVALGAFGASMNHTPNFALDIINKAVDNDIDAQKAEIAKRGQNASNMLAKLKESTGSYEAAENMYKIAALQHAKSQADTLNAQGQDTKLQQQLGNDIQKLQAEHLNYIDAHTAHIPAQLIGGGGMSPKDQELVLDLPTGQSVKARNPDSYKELTEASSAYRKVNADLDNYHKALANVSPMDRMAYAGGHGYITPNMSRALSAYNSALAEFRQANKDGTWKKAEAEGGLFEQTLPSPGAFSGDANAAIGESKRHLTNTLRATVDTHRPIPVETGYARDAKGNVVSTARITGDKVKPIEKEKPKGFTND